MKLETKSFGSKVARRIIFLFFICAVLPIAALALASFGEIADQLYKQSRNRLQQECKSVGMSIYERLWLLKGEMSLVASHLTVLTSSGNNPLSKPFIENLKGQFTDLFLFMDETTFLSLMGNIKKPSRLKLSMGEKAHLETGRALLRVETSPNSPAEVLMIIAIDPVKTGRRLLVGKVNGSFLWGGAKEKPPVSEVMVLDSSGTVLFSSFSGNVSFPIDISRKMKKSHAGHFELKYEEEPYLNSYWTVFLQPNFFYKEWKVVLSELKENVYGPMKNFGRVFPFIVILSLGVVFLLSIGQIRKNLGHIAVLKEATAEIAKGGFGHKVDIKSGDEFETLGEAFNEMSRKLKESQTLLIQGEKMRTIGEMGAGILHEVRQPIGLIYPLLQLLLMDQTSKQGKERIKTVLSAVERLNGILGKFKLFSGRSEEKMEYLSIKHVIAQVYMLLEHQFKLKEIQCNIQSEEVLPAIFGDSQRLQQVFTNLLLNAVDALESKKNGKRSINIRIYTSEQKVAVQVEDNGVGMSKEVQERIFDPFFTTKSPEKGTGLGLAIVGTILHEHNATIELQSQVRKGTTFTIIFPAASENKNK